ncbi:MAG: response regulator [Herminiimonas sp.]|nr:response regulator [Herminiimonas sp.]
MTDKTGINAITGHGRPIARPGSTQDGEDNHVLKNEVKDLSAQIGALREANRETDSQQQLVAQLRQANERLVLATFGAQDQQAAAEKANLAKEEFLAMLAHELRNPLAPISMATELIGKLTWAHPQLPRLHGVISRQATHLTHLLDDLLDASRVNSGKITLQKEPLLLSEILDTAVEAAEPPFSRHAQKLVVDMLDEPIVIDGDQVRLAQAFSNLLINASKFTPDGGKVMLSVTRTANMVSVAVKDDGVGIPAEMQEVIFDLFVQGPQTLARSGGGLGIGLALVRAVATMHGGRIEVHSDGEGHGSEFVLSLPVSSHAALQATKMPGVTKAPSHAKRILLIDDNIDSNETMMSFLSDEGHAISTASEGMSALAMFKENVYDIVICDIGLPGMDGYEVVTRMRDMPMRPAPLFIAMTGYNEPESRARATEAGFDQYFVKPIAVGALLGLVSLSDHAGSRPAA